MNYPKWQQPAQAICMDSRSAAELRQASLTKPPGSLGRLEQVAIDFAGWQATATPTIVAKAIRVFAADHGVVSHDSPHQGVSAFPQAVTREMIRNFCAGGAAITVLAKQHKADFAVVNLGTAEPMEDLPGLVNLQICNGSANICKESAMTEQQLAAAMQAGADNVPEGIDVFVGGEMGIGNTTVAAALISAFLSVPAEQSVGRGTGVDQQGMATKLAAVNQALAMHLSHCDNPFELLRRLGGLEITALVGAFIASAQRGIPVLVDGFIASAAALAAIRINPSVEHWMLFSHCSEEKGHSYLLNAMGKQPLLELSLRLGEGSGAALAIPLLESSLNLHAQMATFAQAQVSEALANND